MKFKFDEDIQDETFSFVYCIDYYCCLLNKEETKVKCLIFLFSDDIVPKNKLVKYINIIIN